MLENLFSTLNPFKSHEENLDHRRKVIRSFKARANANRTAPEKFADWMTAKLGSVPFLLINILLFAAWITINVGWVPGIEPFDTFPFGLLTTIVSLEAIFLAIIVLISQNREAHIAELREEIELQISTISEVEVTKLIKLMATLLEKEGIKVDEDPELRKMVRPVDNTRLENQLKEELEAKK